MLEDRCCCYTIHSKGNSTLENGCALLLQKFCKLTTVYFYDTSNSIDYLVNQCKETVCNNYIVLVATYVQSQKVALSQFFFKIATS